MIAHLPARRPVDSACESAAGTLRKWIVQSIMAHAPGRVELLGNHTDYNEGVVLSAAIDRGVTVHGGRAERRAGGAQLAGAGQAAWMWRSTNLINRMEENWANYALGVVRVFGNRGYEMGGFSMEIVSDLPIGAGLSSSAAFEVATATFLKKLFDWKLEPMELARLCRQVENEFVGVNCGLLDQVSSVFGKKNCADIPGLQGGDGGDGAIPGGGGAADHALRGEARAGGRGVSMSGGSGASAPRRSWGRGRCGT